MLLSSAGDEARGYLLSRGVSNEKDLGSEISWYSIGFAHVDRLDLSACPDQFKRWAEMFLKDKLVFPLHSPLGETIGIQVRGLVDPDHGPKYQQYYCYPHDVFPYLFGMRQSLPHIFETNQAVLVEGVFDYFAVRSIAHNSLAVLTASLPLSAKRFLRRFTKGVTMVTDMDVPGRESIQRLRKDCPELVVFAPEYSEKDPSALAKAGKLKELALSLQMSQRILPA